MSIYSFRIYIEFLFQTRKWFTHIQQNSQRRAINSERKSTKENLKSFLFIISQTKVKMSNSTIGMPDTDYFLSFSCMIDANDPLINSISSIVLSSLLRHNTNISNSVFHSWSHYSHHQQKDLAHLDSICARFIRIIRNLHPGSHSKYVVGLSVPNSILYRSHF